MSFDQAPKCFVQLSILLDCRTIVEHVHKDKLAFYAKILISVGLSLLVISCQFSHQTFAKRLNATKLLEDFFGRPENSEKTGRNGDSLMITRDTSYLPEIDYLEDYEIEKTDQQFTNVDRPDRNLLPEYRSLCEIMTRKVQMSDTKYEYQPPYYHEVFCKSYSNFDKVQRNPVKPARQRCAHPGFHCVQRSRTLFMIRRAWEGDCWEPFTKEIASGCDCMWPVSSLGDISAHY
ncbi:uncharacterized protein [Venturia canescens]|uniref:uncharacterized protein isoform X2 n=1 Tax=Venturia canescens TaxID=32260 RepID=UPI001C9D557A|nr:uncharacterized protein LOC122408991 isoform X2 [Venturia canescens]